MKSLYILLMLFALFSPLAAQQKDNRYEHRKISVYLTDTVIETNVISLDTRTPKKDRFYYWFQNGTIKCNQGGYSGLLLDGKFTVFISSCSSLIESGMFEKGLKQGEWITWSNDGRLKTITHWNKGLLNGTLKMFDKGQLISIYNYKNNKLHGESLFYNSSGDLFKKVLFKNGKEVPLKATEKKAKKDETKIETKDSNQIKKSPSDQTHPETLNNKKKKKSFSQLHFGWLKKQNTKQKK